MRFALNNSYTSHKYCQFADFEFRYPRVNGIKAMNDFAFIGLFPRTWNPFEIQNFWLPIALLAFILFTFYYVVVELQQFKSSPMVYLQDWWNIYEIMSLSICMWLFWKYLVLASESKFLQCISQEMLHSANNDGLIFDDGLVSTGERYLDLSTLRKKYRAAQLALANMAVVSVFKLFKFMRISNRFNFLWRSLHLAFKDLMAFLFIVMIMLSGLALFAYIIFGSNVRDFHSFNMARQSPSTPV